MKPYASMSFIVASALALSLASCKKQNPGDATQPLKETFQQAEPEIKKTIERVDTSLKAGNVPEATRALESIVTGRDMTQAQKDAVGVALNRINQAIAANPALDTKEMYELRAKMFKSLQSGSRF